MTRLTVHHNNSRLAALRLRAAGLPLALIAADGAAARSADDPEHEQRAEEYGVTQPLIAGVREARRRSYAGNIFVPPRAARPGRRWLLDGGGLVIAADTFAGPWARGVILKKAMPIPPGAVWLAQQTSKPIIPLVVRPRGKYWVLWLGEPLPTTTAGVAAGMESCIRQAPASWTSVCWHAWSEMPSWESNFVEEHDDMSGE